QRANVLFKVMAGLNNQGKWADALSRADECVKLCQEAFGRQDLNTAAVLERQGGLLLQLRQPTKARACLEETLAIRRKLLPAQHPDLAGSMNSLGALLWSMGRYGEARPYLEE